MLIIILYFVAATLDGSLGYVIPVSEKTFRRLFILQNTICVMKPHYAGLNPKAYRLLRGQRKELCNPQKNILDGDLLFEYFNMSYMERNDIAKKIKTNTEQVSSLWLGRILKLRKYPILANYN
jgi:cleavage and polyadenylation specificity factor subunit 1